MSSLDRIVRQSGIAELLHPAAQLKQQHAAAQAIDEAGRIRPDAAAAFRTPQALQWAPGDTGRKRVAQGGIATLLAVHAATPPSAGNCVVTVTAVTTVMGESEVGTVSLTSGQAIGETQLAMPVPAGAWLGAEVTTASGASGVSVSLTVKVS